MSTPVSRQQTLPLDELPFRAEAIPFVKSRMAIDQTTLSSMHESSDAEATSFLPICLVNFMNCVWRLFLTLFKISANERIVTYEELIQTGMKLINTHFGGRTVSVPFKVVVVIKFNHATPVIFHANVDEDLESFQREVEQGVSEELRLQHLDGPAELFISTLFAKREDANDRPIYYTNYSYDQVDLRREKTIISSIGSGYGVDELLTYSSFLSGCDERGIIALNSILENY